MKKLSNAENELKKALLIKKRVISFRGFDDFFSNKICKVFSPIVPLSLIVLPL